MSFSKNLDCQNVEKNEILTKINFQKWPIFEGQNEENSYFFKIMVSLSKDFFFEY